MPKKRKTLDERLTSWLRKPAPKQSSEEAELLLTDLQEEQARLSSDLERTLLSYDKQTRKLAKRLALMVHDGADVGELERIREEQEWLWRVIRRVQAAERSDRELEREYQEWRERPNGTVSSGHPDHPDVRREIVASELRIRGYEPAVAAPEAVPSFEGSARDVDPVGDVFSSLSEVSEPALIDEPVSVDANEASGLVLRDDALAGSLMDEIASCTMELKRTMDRPERSLLRDELVLMLKDLRRLHAELRACDRATGTRRYRIHVGTDCWG